MLGSWKRSCRAGAVAFAAAGLMCAGGAGAAAAATPSQVFTTGVALGLPSGAAAAPEGTLNGISCVSAGNCTAAGSYVNAAGNSVPMASTQTAGGAYPTATGLALPTSTHGLTVHDAYFDDVSCTSAGSCVAAGDDRDLNGYGYPVVATESNGTWSQPTELSLPANAATSATEAAELAAVSCWSAGNCVAVGGYTSTSTSDVNDGLIETETNGQWSAAELTSLPAASDGGSYLQSVSCTGDGTCAAGGNDYLTAGGESPIVASGSGGNLSNAQTLALPAGADTTNVNYVTSISCPGDGSCEAIGQDSTTAGVESTLAWTETAGSFGQPTSLAFPANAVANTPTNTQNEYYALSCPSTGNCTASGYYENSTGIQSVAISQAGGVWGTPAAITAPAGAATNAVDGAGGVSVSCTAAGICGLAGDYSTDTAGDSAAMTLSSHQSLGITTTSLPAATAGTPYSAQLAGTGGAGTDSWSLSSGTLPAGLTLDAATGVISGTPTTPETLNFTAALGDSVSDMPATQALGITVNPPANATGTTKVSKIRVKGLTVHATVSCAGPSYDTCAGTLKATVTERVRGHKVISISASRHPGKRKGKAKVKKRTIVLASVHYSLKGGQQRTLTLHLGRKTARLLSAHHRLVIGLTLTATGAKHPKMERKLVLRITHHVRKTKHHKKH